MNYLCLVTYLNKCKFSQKNPYFHKHRVKEDLRTVLLDPKGKKRKKE